MSPILSISLAIITFLIWLWWGKYFFEIALKKKREEAEKVLQSSKKEAREIYTLGEEKSQQLIQKAEKDLERKQEKIDKYEEKLFQKEQKMDEKIERLEEKKEAYTLKAQKLQELVDQEKWKLSEMAWLTQEEAKQQMFDHIKQDSEEDIKRYINKFKMIKEEEAKEEWAKIIAKVLPRLSQEWLSEHLVSMVDLPTEDTKWKIIWREWRNISAFERATWVQVTIDDTPLTIKLSCYDPEKRFMAVETMKKLLKDWRINPVYIENLHQETLEAASEIFLKKWKETLQLLNIPMMKPEIVERIGKFHIRYSYGQNLLLHSIEVAKLSEMLANELWLNSDLAKKAWLLHDIGKIDATTWEWHAKIGAEILRKHKMHDIIVNTAEWHHFDVPLTSPEAWVVTAADAISASRPWARFDNKDIFHERMKNLETSVLAIPGITKAYIMQAWREIMAFVNPDEISDLEFEETIKSIWVKIEEQLDYPGSIRVVWMREKKVVHYLR